MSLADSLCRVSGTLVRRNKNQLCDYMTTEPSQLAGIPGGNFPSSHACRAARRMNQARNRTAGNVHAHCFPGSCDQALTGSFIVTQFACESFGIYLFHDSCMREYD